jgi:hypothetical protein
MRPLVKAFRDENKKAPTLCKCLKTIGGAEEDRTPDLDIANVALSQLSYCPNKTYVRSDITSPKILFIVACARL